MTQNDNFKYYYGQSLIDKDTVSEYESILDYIVAHGGKGSKIDADMLDGYDSSDFLLVGDSDAYMPPGFYIGYTPIINAVTAGLQFLYARDMKLEGEYSYMFTAPSSESTIILKIEQFYDDILGEGQRSPIETAKAQYIGDWEIDHKNNILNAGLIDLELAIRCLLEYENKNKDELDDQIGQLRELLFDPDDFNKLKYILEHYLVSLPTYDDEGNITNNMEWVLDAGSVNGLRFFLVTQRQYDAYPAAIREDPRYIFIIRDDVPEAYVTPTTISAGSFKPLFKTDGVNILVSVDHGNTYYVAGKLYQFDEDEDGLIPMYVGDNTLPTLLADSTLLGDNFFINGAWMRTFLGTDPTEPPILEDIINNQISTLKATVETLEEGLDNKYELKSNKEKKSIDTNPSEDKYPSSYAVMANIVELQDQITALQQKIGQIDTLLTGILGTGTD